MEWEWSNAVEMWEPAVGAGFQAPWDGQQIFGKDSAIGSTERHFHSEPAILPHFGANVVVGCCARPKSWFPESRVECTLLQILVQSPFSIPARPSQGGPDSFKHDRQSTAPLRDVI